MKKNYGLPARPLLGSLALLFSLTTTSAQQRAAVVLLRDEAAVATPLSAALARSRPLTLDVATTRTVLATAPAETQAGAAPLVVALPLPDGSTGRFAVWQTSVMAPALAARYPEIQTYAGRGLDDASATVRLDLTPAGFHAQILSATAGAVYIDPARRGDQQHYVSFYQRDMQRAVSGGMICNFKPSAKDTRSAPGQRTSQGVSSIGSVGVASGRQLRTYRLAVAATGEYTAFHGGTVPSALAAIVTTVNRVVGVYEKELAVRLVLVANNNLLIYTDGDTDPYTNNSGDLMLDENQINVDRIIGSSNYDIGHIFSTNGGGVASYAVVCLNGFKARGVTGTITPVADAFDIDYVAHEIGHQFSGSHSFNGTSDACGDGNRSGDRAWEPGSGSTIMAYAGICTPQNLQANSDPFFHVGSFEEMRSFIISTPCPGVTPTDNTPPVVGGPASNLTLPIGTPFRLTATAVDADGDALTYSWEELDLGSAGGPTDPQAANDNVPLFRSFAPTTSPTRYFPRLTDLVNNSPSIGERLPTVTRRLTFKCTARDQHSGSAGVIGGVTSSDSVKLRVTSAAGPFLVSSPNTATTWNGGSTQTVTWDVAGTTANGVNCANVNIRLSTDGGLTYPTTLVLGVANSGSASIVVPNIATSTARIMVEAADNYFFDISDANFTINSSAPCAPPTALAVSNITNTGASVSFAPAIATQYVVTTTPATTAQTVTASPVTLTGLTSGTNYTVNVVAICGSTSSSAAATTSFTTTTPTLCEPPSELALRNRTLTTATVSFLGTASATSYTVTTVPASTTQTVATASPVTLTGLTPGASYTVRIVSNCAGGDTSPASTLRFRTIRPVPVNDLCSAALPLTCGVPVQGYTEGSTATGDPSSACNGETVDGGGVFYTFAGDGQQITVSTCELATDFDTKLFVYRGSCGAYTCVGANDDIDPANCGVASAVSFNSVAGETYYIFVSGYAGATGSFGLRAACTPVTSASVAKQASFQVWPNPAGTNAAFRIGLPTPATAATVTLHNVLGQRLAQRTFNGTSTELPTTGLAPGTYLLTVEVTGQAPAVRRVIVE